jgi:hypothetical protein
MLEALAAVYEKTERTMDLPEGTREILKKQLNQTHAHSDVEIGRRFLACGDFDRAKESLTSANNSLHSVKLELAILGLQIAPRLTRFGATTWQKMLALRQHLRRTLRRIHLLPLLNR